MSEGLRPDEIHPALVLDHVNEIGNLIWNVRRRVALRMEKDEGDGMWGAGCNSWERTKFALGKMSTDGAHPWLSVGVEDGVYLIKIGGVPCRFYRGRADKPTPAKYTERRTVEQRALQLAFDLVDTPTPDYVLRFEIQTDSSGYPTGVWLFQVDAEGGHHNVYQVPVREHRKTKRLATAKRREAVKLPAPKVESIAEKKARTETRSQPGDSAS